MNIPDNLRIGPILYTVKKVKDLHFHDTEWKRHSLMGHILYQDAEISILEEMNDGLVHPTLLHEAIHGMLHQAGHDEHEENQVIALGYALVEFIKANPEFIKGILEDTGRSADAD